MARTKQQQGGHQLEILAAIPAACADERTAVEFLERQRWGDSPACPRCGDTDVYQMRGRGGKRNARFLWACRGCRQQFTVRIGTVFEDSRIPLRHWCFGFWAACASKKGVSAMQIQRQTRVSYKSALFLMHRIRFAMADNGGTPLGGIVEIDETYVGGKPRKGSAPVHHMEQGRFRKGPALDFKDRKTPVVAMVDQRAIFANVDRSARIMTDERPTYRAIGKQYAGHDVVNHSRGEYARGDVTTNTVEGFFSLLKRGVYGTFHSISRTHLHRYVSEFTFRYNTRKLDDGERTMQAIRGAEGKRLMVGYRQPRAGE